MAGKGGSFNRDRVGLAVYRDPGGPGKGKRSARSDSEQRLTGPRLHAVSSSRSDPRTQGAVLIDPHLWKQARSIFADALELSAQERKGFLDAACGDDPEIRAEVESLLRADTAGHEFLDTAERAELILDSAEGPPDSGGSEPSGGSVAAVSSSPPPDRIGRYPVLGGLGRGGMGIVYLAEDPTLERQIAIKLLPAGLARNQERWDRFAQEAKLLAAVNHPGIATVYSLEDEDGVRFLTMELLEGESLAAKLDRMGSLGILESIRVGQEIAVALTAAHAAGVVHRDLNLTISRNRRAGAS